MERLIIVPERKVEKSEIFEKNIYLSGELTLAMTLDNFWLNPMDFYCFNVF